MFSPCGPLLVQVEKNYTLQRKHYRVFGLVSKVNLDSVSSHRPSAVSHQPAPACAPEPRVGMIPMCDPSHFRLSTSPPPVRRGQSGRLVRTVASFYVVGHGVDEALSTGLEELSREFFEKPSSEKLAIGMELGGRAWGGYFPVGDELTSGSPDQKEGIYFGAELPASHPKVVAGTPLHGANLFPDGMPGFRETVLDYIDVLTGLGHRIIEAVALSLGLDAAYLS